MRLCDTNVLSELVRPLPNPGVLAWAHGETRVAISVVTVDELFFGLSWHPRPKIRSWLERFLSTRCQILEVTPRIARLAGELRGRLRSAGINHSQADMWIAATARYHSLTLVTRNVKHFEYCGISIVNPFV
ncbi:MAG: type II toxin-antitoxin system VapC family toxin [bacterium]|nr:type II toxin-antitoxin system VapC family toxin [bacterium]